MKQIEKEFLDHKVFEQLLDFSNFYESLSYSTMGVSVSGIVDDFNLNSNVFSSIKGTLDSIRLILSKQRVNDSYALLRKYYDATIINIYTHLYLEDHCDVDNFIVEHINNWVKGEETIPEYRVISKYIKDSKKLKPITVLLNKDELYKSVRDRCNDHTHYNFYYNLKQNIDNLNNIEVLDLLYKDLIAVFVQHFAYFFYLNNHYMTSSDYVDCLDCGIIPEEGSQYWVAPYIQETFDKWIKPNRPDIADEIKSKSIMDLK